MIRTPTNPEDRRSIEAFLTDLVAIAKGSDKVDFSEQPAQRLRPPLMGPYLTLYLVLVLYGVLRVVWPSPSLHATSVHWYATAWPFALIFTGSLMIAGTLNSARSNHANTELFSLLIHLSVMLGYLVSLVSLVFLQGWEKLPGVLFPVGLSIFPLWRVMNIVLRTEVEHRLRHPEDADHVPEGDR